MPKTSPNALSPPGPVPAHALVNDASLGSPRVSNRALMPPTSLTAITTSGTSPARITKNCSTSL